jgi:hypothetical protein
VEEWRSGGAVNAFILSNTNTLESPGFILEIKLFLYTLFTRYAYTSPSSRFSVR